MGRCLVIPGVGRRIVEDTGRAIVGRALDVFFERHEDALEFGVRTLVITEEC
jgi:3D (Asp-Asp-Asp) domain-containing protein